MIVWSELLAFVLLGLFGSLHCFGMCGGFAIAVASQSRRRALNLLAGQAHYILGKALTYAVLGLLIATVGTWIAGAATEDESRNAFAFSTARSVLSWLAGLGLIGMGCFHLGWRPAWTTSASASSRSFVHALVGPARRMLESVRELPGWASAFGTGLLNGLLPCGLSLAALLLASKSSPFTAFLGAFLFGLMTAPALLAAGLGSDWLTSRWSRHATKFMGVALVAFGVITVMRG